MLPRYLSAAAQSCASNPRSAHLLSDCFAIKSFKDLAARFLGFLLG